MRILITGANGQVGQELVIIAQQRGISYLSYDRAQLDITDAIAVQTVVDKQNPDIVINAAAYTAVDAAEENIDTAFSVNRDGVENLALACRRKDIPLLHISTDFIFDGNKSGAYSEEDIAAPISIYGKSKLAGEEVLADTLEKHIILRTSWVYSAHGDNFVKTMLGLMKERDQLQVVNDQWGCPTSAQNIAVALLDIAKSVWQDGSQAWGTYHFCAQGKTNWYEFAREILAQANQLTPLNTSILPITSQEWVSAAERPKNSELSCKKTKTVFGITCSPWVEQLKPVIERLCSI